MMLWQPFTHSKKISWIYLPFSFLIGSLITYALLNCSLKDIQQQTGTSRPNFYCDYNITRVKGYELIRPLLSIEPSCESNSFGLLKTKLTALTDSLKKTGDINRASIYFREFTHGEWAEINGTGKYHPASLMKIALLLIYLKMAEVTPGLLAQKLTYDKPDSVTITPQYYSYPVIKKGQSYTVHELLYYMIVNSDNHATWLLSKWVDVSQTKKLFYDIGLPEPTEDDLKFTMTAQECSVFFKAIHNASYVSHELSEYAAKLLNNSAFKEGFVKGMPEGTKIWHKFGEWRSSGQEYELHESGIFYYEDVPYLLTVMTSGTNTDKLASSIGLIARAVYDRVSAP